MEERTGTVQNSNAGTAAAAAHKEAKTREPAQEDVITRPSEQPRDTAMRFEDDRALADWLTYNYLVSMEYLGIIPDMPAEACQYPFMDIGTVHISRYFNMLDDELREELSDMPAEMRQHPYYPYLARRIERLTMLSDRGKLSPYFEEIEAL
ncbi:hypothetical protein SLS58_010570 [Diplodia intermedia]|uniref:Uncharacterized protein n=1 Tax=Diplodia intermedia TaxID=856260 RepID=A0ABR3T527_9PEZI